MRLCLICVCASGCFVGFPPVGEQGWLDTAVTLPSPDCAAVSDEPDDGTADLRFSSFGLLTDEPRTLCGDIAHASNDGQNYTGDVDYALLQTIDEGRARFELRWEGSTALDLLLGDGNTSEWTAGEDGVLELKLEPGFHTVLVAGVDGPPTGYELSGWLE